MTRTSYRMADSADDRIYWFDADTVTLAISEETRWNGANNVGRITGSQWCDEALLRTAGGAWVIRRDNRDGRRHGQQVGQTFRGVSPEVAEEWLRKQDLHELADDAFAPVGERAPGRPDNNP